MRAKDEGKEQLILETALGLIARVGLSGLKMTELARQAGLATGTVYIYFEDKASLIRQLYLYLAKKSTVDLLKGAPANAPLKLRIQKLAENYLEENLRHPEYSAFFEQYYRSPFFENDLQIVQAEESLLQPIYDLVKEGQEQKLLKETDPAILVTLVCGMLNELARQALLEQRPLRAEERKIAFQVLWDGIRG